VVVVSRFFRKNESQPVIEATRSRIHPQNREDNPALACKRFFNQLSCEDCTETLSLMLGGYAECVQLNVLSTLNCHKKADAQTLMLDDPRLWKLQLFVELCLLSGFIPIPTCSRDMNLHGTQKHISHESNIVIGCATCCYQPRHICKGITFYLHRSCCLPDCDR